MYGEGYNANEMLKDPLSSFFSCKIYKNNVLLNPSSSVGKIKIEFPTNGAYDPTNGPNIEYRAYDKCYIGKSDSTQDRHLKYFKGNIDDFRLYNRKITEVEINDLYTYIPNTIYDGNGNVEFGDSIDDMILWYKFDENLLDSSSNGRDADKNYNPIFDNNPIFDKNLKQFGTSSLSFAGENGFIKKIYSLTGTNDDYLIIPVTNFSTYDGISVSLWIKWESLKHYSRIFRLGNGDNDLPDGNSILMYEVGTTHDIGVEINNNGPIGGSNMKATFTYKNFIVLNTWTHIVLSVGRYPNTLYLYKNGVLQSPNDDTKGNQVVWLPDCVYDQCFK